MVTGRRGHPRNGACLAGQNRLDRGLSQGRAGSESVSIPMA